MFLVPNSVRYSSEVVGEFGGVGVGSTHGAAHRSLSGESVLCEVGVFGGVGVGGTHGVAHKSLFELSVMQGVTILHR